MKAITVNVLYDSYTQEIIITRNSRNWLRKHHMGWSLPRYWKFSSMVVPADYFNK